MPDREDPPRLSPSEFILDNAIWLGTLALTIIIISLLLLAGVLILALLT